MIKTYQLQRLQNFARVILENNKSKNGDKATFDFQNGNVVEGLRPQITLTGKYYQDILESSELFKNHTVVLIRQEKTDEDYAEEARIAAEKEKANKDADELLNASNPKPEPKNVKVNVVDNVTTVNELMTYTAGVLGIKAKTASQALSIAQQKGYSFPNLEEIK